MSQFTSATNGILRSEIPAQFFNQLKTYAINLFDGLPAENWKQCMDRIQQWTDADVSSEVNRIKLDFPDIEENCRYTILRAIKTVHIRTNKTPLRINSKYLGSISFGKFLQAFFQRLVQSKNIASHDRYDALNPSDMELISRDCFRHILYGQVESLYPSIVETTAQPVAQEEFLHTVVPEDSVSCAPSEIISYAHQEPESLSQSLLKLHVEKEVVHDIDMLSRVGKNEDNAQNESPSRKDKAMSYSSSRRKDKAMSDAPQKDKAMSYASKRTSRSKQFARSRVAQSHISRASKKYGDQSRSGDTIEVDMVSSVASKRSSKFSKAPVPSHPPALSVKQPETPSHPPALSVHQPELPSFFEDDGGVTDVRTQFTRQ